MKYKRVREAYSESYDSIAILFQNKGIDISDAEVFLRAIKHERKLELFAKNVRGANYQLIKRYDFCVLSGGLGPKRAQGDMQVPEGFYHIDRFNPTSYFFISLGIDYPNVSDRQLTTSRDAGGDIFIHGDCVSVGCIPLTDKWIKELYVVCTEARNNGQSEIPVHIFPFQMDDYNEHRIRYSTNSNKLKFWDSLTDGYIYFEKNKKLPKITITDSGYYQMDKINSNIVINKED